MTLLLSDSRTAGSERWRILKEGNNETHPATALLFCLDQQSKTHEAKGWFFDQINKTGESIAIATTIRTGQARIALTDDGRRYHSSAYAGA